MSKAGHNILADDSEWGKLKLIAHGRNIRVSDYIEPFWAEIIRLEKMGIDPLAVLKKAGKRKEE